VKRSTAGALAVGLVAGVLVGLLVWLGVAQSRETDGGSSDTAEVGSSLGLGGRVLSEPQPRPQFTLTRTDGTPYDFAEETAGRLTLLFFGYTSCPDVCPIQLGVLSDVLTRSGMPDPIVVFVGVDAARDTPEAVKRFLARYDSHFVGLVGSAPELEAAQRAAGVPVAIAEPAADDGSYLVGHATQILAFTPDDLAHVVYPFGVRAQDWVSDLPRLSTIDWAAAGVG
jgi:protein SCO1/2